MVHSPLILLRRCPNSQQKSRRTIGRKSSRFPSSVLALIRRTRTCPDQLPLPKKLPTTVCKSRANSPSLLAPSKSGQLSNVTAKWGSLKTPVVSFLRTLVVLASVNGTDGMSRRARLTRVSFHSTALRNLTNSTRVSHYFVQP